jgi:hypothetical protein
MQKACQHCLSVSFFCSRHAQACLWCMPAVYAIWWRPRQHCPHRPECRWPTWISCYAAPGMHCATCCTAPLQPLCTCSEVMVSCIGSHDRQLYSEGHVGCHRLSARPLVSHTEVPPQPGTHVTSVPSSQSVVHTTWRPWQTTFTSVACTRTCSQG